MFKLIKLIGLVWFGFMVFYATFNNISVILWWLVLLVKETGVPGKKTPICRKQLTNFITQCCTVYISPWTAFELITSVVIGSDCTGSCKLIKLKMCSLIELLFYVFSELRILVTMATVFNGVLDVTYKSDVSLVPIKGQLQLKFNQIYTMSTNKHDILTWPHSFPLLKKTQNYFFVLSH